MAEAFGLAAGVLQVADFGAEVSSTLFKCAKKFNNASKELEEIASQVKTTSVSLGRVDALLKDPTTKALHTQKLYDDTMTVSNGCFEVFRELDHYVTSFEPKSGFGKMTLRSKVRWLQSSSKLQGLGQVLRRYCDVLHLMISVMAIVEGRRAATKDELQTLEADLKLLALSNKDLSRSNKTLTETIAAISQASVNSVVPQATTPPAVLPVTDGQSLSRAMPLSTLFAMPHVKLSPIVPRKQNPSDQMSDHLQRCMKSVQELALSISCALDALYGHEKTGSSDVHGSFGKLSIAMAQLPTHVQCDQCKQIVSWSQFKPVRNGIGCKCSSQTPPPPPSEPCSSPIDSWACKRKFDIHVQGGQIESRDALVQQSQSQEIDKAAQSLVRRQLDHITFAELGVQAYQSAEMREVPSSPTDLMPSDNNESQVLAFRAPEISARCRQTGHSLVVFDQGTASLIPPTKPAQDGGDSNEYFSSGNKPLLFSSEPDPFENAFISDPTSTPGHPRLSGPWFRAPKDTPMIARPSGTQQGGRKICSHLSREAKDRSSRMRRIISTKPERRTKPRKSTSRVTEDGLCDDQDNLVGNQQRHRATYTQRHPSPDNVEHFDSVGGGSLDGECFDLDLDLGNSVGNNPLHSNSTYRPNSNGVKDMTNEPNGHLVPNGGIDSILRPRASTHHSHSSGSHQQRKVSMPEAQASQHWVTQRPLSPSGYLMQLALLEGQNKRRYLMTRNDQNDFAYDRVASSPSSCGSIARRRKKSCGSDRDERNINVETDPANASLQKTASSKKGQTGTMMASAPGHLATSAPEGFLYGSGPRVDESFKLNIDSLDFSVRGGDVLGNFDFDGFLNMDDGGMGFDFPDFDGDMEGVTGDAQDHSSLIQTDTDTGPQHGQKRSLSDAFPGFPKHAPISHRKRRAAPLSPHTGVVCESSVEVAELPTDSNKNEVPTNNLSGVEALLRRWFDASASAVLLRPSDG